MKMYYKAKARRKFCFSSLFVDLQENQARLQENYSKSFPVMVEYSCYSINKYQLWRLKV